MEIMASSITLEKLKDGLSKICLEGMVEGKRNRGRTHKRWRDNVYLWSNLHLNQLNTSTQDRDQWRVLSHVSAHSSLAGDSVT